MPSRKGRPNKAPRVETPEAKASRIANLQRGRETPIAAKTLPALRAETALVYVKIRRAGVPPIDAIQPFVPKGETWTRSQRALASMQYENSPLVVEAWETLHGGSWVALDDDTRIRHALDLHAAQMAYYLRTHDFASSLADTKKMSEARLALREHIEAAHAADRGDKFTLILEQMLGDTKSLPPVFQSATARLRVALAPKLPDIE